MFALEFAAGVSCTIGGDSQTPEERIINHFDLP
jgi:hypothetical protein